MKTLLLILLLPILVCAQEQKKTKFPNFEHAKMDTVVEIFDGKEVMITTKYVKDKNKETSASEKSLTPFDGNFYKYVKVKPILDEKEQARLLKKQAQKVLDWCKKHNVDIGVLTAKNTCTSSSVAWPISMLSNKQITDLVSSIFKQSDILCYLWDLTELGSAVGSIVGPTVEGGKEENKVMK